MKKLFLLTCTILMFCSGCTSLKYKLEQKIDTEKVSKERIKDAVKSVLLEHKFIVHEEDSNIIFTEWDPNTSGLDVGLNLFNSVIQISQILSPKKSLIYQNNEYISLIIILDKDKYIISGKRKTVREEDKIVSSNNCTNAPQKKTYEYDRNDRVVRQHSVMISDMNDSVYADKIFLQKIAAEINGKITEEPLEYQWIENTNINVQYDIEKRMNAESGANEVFIN